ncbi:phenylalanine--tRNA ligase subunit alpha [Candidatus Berkelbacteria bacterium RBG_13_40_8]|uniref:phenylalanine--tRNA ligase n=1 Tax=Candidatus Berkelbacteria bacterium RBG_13_40_8 TaxID=1797467 RepID=A0A1F5DQ75_9BACT|nr:MAG: phenylalanine--tRNA ligase subunit alpha [Candidatus Berkelbacteria bacterium RBG_13_40_8]
MNGHLHPLTQFMRLSLRYFEEHGFTIADGPEIETEWYNFDALNVPANHPSRDIQDTFWTKDDRVLRTHTTSTDVREVKEKNLQPPLKLIIPGRCFRNEATDLAHEHTFYQIDGIAIDEDLNMGHLIGLLDGYMKELFGKAVKTRVRPHLYPFVEPGMDLDIKLPNGKWQEMLGAGMGHPVVLKNMGIDPEKYQAIMFGMGIDRYMMEYFKADDIRLSYAGDMRFLKQF